MTRVFMPFNVICGHCAHINRPDKSPRLGVERVLTGEFLKCNKCGTEFASIHVPATRPLVREIASRLGDKVSKRINITDTVALNAKGF